MAIGTSGPSLSWLPAQLAWKLGYFREEGLEAEFVQVGGTSVIPALFSGELHFTTILSAVGANAGQGGDTRIVQFHSVRLQHVLSVRPEITAIPQLAGKRIAVQNLGTLTALEARKVAEHFNLPDVALVAVGSDLERIAALESNAADANVTAIPMNLLAEKRGLPTLLRIGSILEIPQAGFGTSLEHLRDRPALLTRALRAAARAFPFVTGQPDVTTATIAEFMELAPDDAARAYEMVADTFTATGGADRRADGRLPRPAPHHGRPAGHRRRRRHRRLHARPSRCRRARAGSRSLERCSSALSHRGNRPNVGPGLVPGRPGGAAWLAPAEHRASGALPSAKLPIDVAVLVPARIQRGLNGRS